MKINTVRALNHRPTTYNKSQIHRYGLSRHLRKANAEGVHTVREINTVLQVTTMTIDTFSNIIHDVGKSRYCVSGPITHLMEDEISGFPRIR